MTLLQIVAAALISAGSVLVLRAVWMADTAEMAPPAAPVPAPAPEPAEAASEWREAA